MARRFAVAVKPYLGIALRRNARHCTSFFNEVAAIACVVGTVSIHLRNRVRNIVKQSAEHLTIVTTIVGDGVRTPFEDAISSLGLSQADLRILSTAKFVFMQIRRQQSAYSDAALQEAITEGEQADLSHLCKLLAAEFPFAKQLNSMARQASAERAWSAISRFYDNCKKGIRPAGYPKFKKFARSVEYKTTGWKLKGTKRLLSPTRKASAF